MAGPLLWMGCHIYRGLIGAPLDVCYITGFVTFRQVWLRAASRPAPKVVGVSAAVSHRGYAVGMSLQTESCNKNRS